MRPLDNNGFANGDVVAAAVGDISINLVCPKGNVEKHVVQVTLTKTGEGYRRPGVLSSILRNALNNYWRDCNSAVLGITRAPVRLIEIYAPARGGETPRLAL